MSRFLLLVLIAFSYSSDGNGIRLLEKDAKKGLAWWQERIIYQIYPRSHMDFDGDGVGDLLGIKSKLDHFNDIGINAVWISPIYKSPMKDFGYDISNFTEIEPVFGNMSTLRSLSNALKARDIKLIMDFVPNHSSDEHPWFQLSIQKVEPYTDYYVWKDPKGFDENGRPLPPNNWVSVFGGSAWKWHEERQQFYLHQFAAEQPDLNYRNPDVIKEILGALKFWLDEGVDGFRVDAVAFMFEDLQLRDQVPDSSRPADSLPNDWHYWKKDMTYNLPEVMDVLAVFRKLIDDTSAADGKERCMMVEVASSPIDELFEYYGTQEKPIAHFPLNFEFINRFKDSFTAKDILGLVNDWLEKMPAGQTANWAVGNHDNNRVASRFGTHTIDQLNMILHLLPGSSVMYYGEEIGMEDTSISWKDTKDPVGCKAGPERFKKFSRDPERTPMQWDDTKNAGFTSGNSTWLPVNENYVSKNVAVQRLDQESHLNIFKKISQLRKTESWKYGSLVTGTLGPENSVFGFARLYNGKGFLVLSNFGSKEETISVEGMHSEIPSYAKVYIRSHKFVPAETMIGDWIKTAGIKIGAKHSLILEFSKNEVPAKAIPSPLAGKMSCEKPGNSNYCLF